MTLLQGPKGPLSLALMEALERPGLLAGPVGHQLSRRGPAFALGSCWRLRCDPGWKDFCLAQPARAQDRLSPSSRNSHNGNLSAQFVTHNKRSKNIFSTTVCM